MENLSRAGGHNVRQGTGIQVKKTRRARKAVNAGGKSKWMREFFSRPSLPMWQALKPWKGEQEWLE